MVTAITKDIGLSRPTVRKHILTVEEPQYKRVQPEAPKLGPFKEQLTQWLIDDAKLARPRRRCGHRMYEGLHVGAYDSPLCHHSCHIKYFTMNGKRAAAPSTAPA